MEVRGPALELTEFKAIIDRLNPAFKGTHQQDAEELLSCLLNWLHDELKDFGHSACDTYGEEWWLCELFESSLVRETFGFMLQYRTTCNSCGMDSVNTDPPLLILPVPIPSNGSCTVQGCLESVFRKEAIPEYRCSYCETSGGCSRVAKIIHPPAVLILQLKRFAVDSNLSHALKLCTPVTLPRIITLRHSSTSTEATKYHLRTIVRHQGIDLHGGHYTCVGRRGKAWCEFNDTAVQVVVNRESLSTIGDNDAYILIYETVQDEQSSFQDAAHLLSTDCDTVSPAPSINPPDATVSEPPPEAIQQIPNSTCVENHRNVTRVRPHSDTRQFPRRTVGISAITAPQCDDTVARMPDPFTPVFLTQDDVPGAKLVRQNIEQHTIDQLKRWLACRGLPHTATKQVLVKRCKAAIDNNRLQIIDPSIDGGKWYQLKRDEVYRNIPDACRPPILPVTGWLSFPSQPVPPTFSSGSIESYLIERHPTFCMDEVDSDGDLQAPQSMNVGTYKPLKRGYQYLKSGHVREVCDSVTRSHYFLKAVVFSSFHKNRKYMVFVTCSKSTGYVVEGFCECRQRALGRCSHVASLLLFVLDHVQTKGYAAMTCTSRPQAWGQGTLQRKPGMARTTDYPSRKSISQKSHRDPRAQRSRNRWTPQERKNFLLGRLMRSTKAYGWETLMTLHYEDFPINDDFCEYIGSKCCQFIHHLREGAQHRSKPCFPITEGQSGDKDWHSYRSWMITASRSKHIVGLTSENAKSEYLLNTLWLMGPRIFTTAMEYGITNESVAKKDYLSEIRKTYPQATIIDTGLWALHKHPQLGCSPDGLVDDGKSLRLLEVKCPYILKDFDPNSFESVLNKGQLSRFCVRRADDGELYLKTNHEYYFQIQMCLGIHSIEYCDLFVWSKHGYLCIPVKFDRKFWEALKQKLLEIHSTLVVPEYFAMRVVRGLTPMLLPKGYLPCLFGRSNDIDGDRSMIED